LPYFLIAAVGTHRIDPCDKFSAIPFLEASFCERPGLIRRVPSKPDPIWEAGEKGVLLGMKWYKMQKRDKKTAKKVLYKQINIWIPA